MRCSNDKLRQFVSSSEVHVWIEDCSRVATKIGTPTASLSSQEVARARRYHFAKDHNQYIYRHAMLRKVLGMYTGEPPYSLKILHTDSGKPYLDCSDLHFNLSHSGTFFAIAVARGRQVGVDIESLRPLEECDRIAERIMTPGEYQQFRSCSGHRRSAFFITCWVRKEAVVKAWGCGITSELNKIAVMEGKPSLGFHALQKSFGGIRQWSIKDFFLDDVLAGAACNAGNGILIRMIDPLEAWQT